MRSDITTDEFDIYRQRGPARFMLKEYNASFLPCNRTVTSYTKPILRAELKGEAALYSEGSLLKLPSQAT